MTTADPNQTRTSPPDRLFIAVDLPGEVKERLAKLKQTAGSISWTTWANLHLTLKFIGSRPAELAERIRASLRQVKFEGFSLELNGLGCFEGRGGTILWAGLSAAEPLLELEQKIDRALVGDGLIEKKGRFTPHITLARLKKRPAIDPRDFAAKYSHLAAGVFAVNSFVLYKSDLRPSGAVHSAVELYPAG